MNEGTILQHADRVTFRYERRLPAPVEVVWAAITDPDEIGHWIGNRLEIDLVVGGRYVTYHGDGNLGKLERVVDRVVRLDAPRLFEHTFWEHVNPTALVTWELRPVEDGCLLVLTHSLTVDDVEAAAATLPIEKHPAVILARNGAGWHRLLDRLGDALAGEDAPWSAQDQRDLQDRYAARVP